MRFGRRRMLYATLLAIGLHVDLLLLLAWLFRSAGPPQLSPDGEEAIALETIDDGQARQILEELDRQTARDEAEQRKKEQESVQAPGQVIELPAPTRPERPRETRFAAELDATTEHETKRNAPPSKTPGAASSPPLLAMREPTPPGQRRAPAQGNAGVEKELKQAARSASPPPVPSDADGALPKQTAGPPDRPDTERDSQASGARAGGQLALTPNAGQLARALGGGPLDHLVDVDDGDQTSLNARSWKFASFFNRVKRQVAEHWLPASAYGRRDPTGNIYGNGQWVTLVQIQLKPDGALAGVTISKPSGLEFLDDVAIEAIKEGSPYPNPPPQLMDESGTIRFKFGFFFDVGSGPHMKVYRYSGL